jgi:hypothetical protein
MDRPINATELYEADTMSNWIQHQVNLQNVVRDIPEEEAFCTEVFAGIDLD